MANTINKKQILTGSLSLFFLVLAGLLGTKLSKPIIKVSKQDSAINFNTDLVKIFSMGQKRVLADLIWITTLLESDVDHYKKDDLNSWMYLRFKTLFRLDSKFLNGYHYAGKYLSIVKDDLQGAKEIFEQGLSIYPQDYQLNIDAGFLYGFELNDFKEAKKRYEIAMVFPQAPDFLRSLVAKFDYKVTNNKKYTFKFLNETYRNLAANSNLKYKLKKDLYALKAEIDLECLNTKNLNCSLRDFNGNKYIKVDNFYTAQESFQKYELRQKKREE